MSIKAYIRCKRLQTVPARGAPIYPIYIYMYIYIYMGYKYIYTYICMRPCCGKNGIPAVPNHRKRYPK